MAAYSLFHIRLSQTHQFFCSWAGWDRGDAGVHHPYHLCFPAASWFYILLIELSARDDVSPWLPVKASGVSDEPGVSI